MIDIHSHILPGVDDGSQNMEDSLQMAAMAAGSGSRAIVATPHSNQEGRFENFYTPQLAERFRMLRSEVSRAGIPLTVYPGMEIFASDDIEEKILSGRLIGLNHTRYYLVEFHFDETPSGISRCLNHIFRAGGIPLIAHPERYYCVQDRPELIYEWLQNGCLAQINKGSLFGRFGSGARQAAEILLFNGLVTCIGSDAHSPVRRTTHMRDTLSYLYDQLGEEITWLITEENPSRILKGLPVPVRGRDPRESRYLI